MYCFFLVKRFNSVKEKYDWLFIGISISMILMTGTRTIILGSIGAIIYYLLCAVIQNNTKGRKKYILITTIIIIGIISVSLSSFIFEKIAMFGQRDYLQVNASNATRLRLYQIALTDWSKTIKGIILGNGGGHIEKLTQSTTIGRQVYLPVHQDFILILCEYGVLGLVLIYRPYKYSPSFDKCQDRIAE